MVWQALVALASSELACETEDEVLVWIARSCLRSDPRAWRCVRLPWLSSGAISALRESLHSVLVRASTHSSSSSSAAAAPHSAGPILPIPLEVADGLSRTLDAAMHERAARREIAFRRPVTHAQLGAAALSDAVDWERQGTDWTQWTPDAPARLSYAFTLDVDGTPWNRVTAAVGSPSLPVMFVWLSPEHPVACNDSRVSALPAAYARNVRDWSEATGQSAIVLNGLQCLSAVRQAATHPALRGLDSSYRLLLRRRQWVRCVDMARVAALWLLGGIYCDTDLGTGSEPLPRPLRDGPGSPAMSAAAAAAAAASPSSSSSSVSSTRMSVGPLVVPKDREGILQNCFFATTSPGHPFLGALLAVRCVVSCNGCPG